MKFYQLTVALSKTVVRDRSTMFFTFLFPLLMTTVFGFASRQELSSTPAAMMITGSDPTSGALASRIKDYREAGRDDPAFEITEARSEAEIETLFSSGEIDVAFIIPDLSQPGTVTLLYDERSADGVGRARTTLRAIVQTYNLEAAGSKETITVGLRGLRSDKALSGFDQLLPTLLMFGVVFGSMGASATRYANYRESGAFKRLHTTPLKPHRFMLAELVVRSTISIFQAATVLLLASRVFDAKLPGNPAWLLLMVMIGTAVFTGVGVIIANVAKTPDAASSLSGLVATIFFFTGGGGFSDLLPAGVTRIFEGLPFAIVINHLETILLDATHPFTDLRESAMLAGWTLIIILVSLKVFSFREPRERS